ncbi:hypothetical protein [Saccharothrix obliqua]|uniref:hypothetical protein n=1 Tax=Saccharothrix obliqua TaxID=2861747 RepID=UPI001C5F2FF5|nr:hypothetical protein [Saccharothrix obliqua]MBW4717239.1 hypothetical protein [Saccharothrix obliqua]
MTAHRGTLTITTPPAIPLARTVQMPDGFEYDSGALGFRLEDLEILPVEAPAARPVAVDGGTTVALPSFEVRARYRVEATRDAVATVDGGGDLSELPDSATAPRTGRDITDHDRDEWVDNAKAQEDKLNKTPNGQKLVKTYYEHNEVYGELFETDKGTFVRDVWSKKGGTTQMAAHTHGAVKQDDVVNQGEYPSLRTDDQVSYNAAAFARHDAMTQYTKALDPNYDPLDPDNVAAKYKNAVEASLQFRTAVRNDTGNTDKAVTQMRSGAVYEAVEKHSGGLPEVGPELLHAYLAPHETTWSAWEEGQHDELLFHHNNAIEGRAALRAADTPKEVFSGGCFAHVTGATAVIGADGAVRVDLPELAVEVDDSAWTGPAGDVARQHLEAGAFLPDLLRGLVAQRLREAVNGQDPRVVAVEAR